MAKYPAGLYVTGDGRIKYRGKEVGGVDPSGTLTFLDGNTMQVDQGTIDDFNTLAEQSRSGSRNKQYRPEGSGPVNSQMTITTDDPARYQYDNPANMRGPGAAPSAELGASMANKQYDPDELLAELLKELKAPIDWNDPEFASILAQSENSAERRARQAGIEGPMSIGATQAAGTNARTALQGQRNERYDRALSLASNRSLTKEQFDIQRQKLAEDQYQYDAGIAANQQQGQGSFWGGLLGAGASVAGHLINPAGGFLSQLGNFAQGGASLGGGLAGSYGRPPARNSYRRGSGGY
jgi:hypothetical protein